MSSKSKSSIHLFGLHDRDLTHHAVLVVIVFTGFLAIMYSSQNTQKQFMIGLFTTVLYIGWGIFHHYHDGDLHIKSVIEYVLLGFLGILVLGVLFL